MRWRDVDLAAARLRVPKSKTPAGERVVDLSPDLLDELKAHRIATPFGDPNDFVFPTSRGTQRDRSNVLKRVLRPAIRTANEVLADRGLEQIPPTVTMHSLRHTYASLLVEASADPAYVMAQIGHRNARFTLETYTHVRNRERNVTSELDALIRGDATAAAVSPEGSRASTAS